MCKFLMNILQTPIVLINALTSERSLQIPHFTILSILDISGRRPSWVHQCPTTVISVWNQKMFLHYISFAIQLRLILGSVPNELTKAWVIGNGFECAITVLIHWLRLFDWNIINIWDCKMWDFWLYDVSHDSWIKSSNMPFNYLCLYIKNAVLQKSAPDRIKLLRNGWGVIIR